MNILASLGVPLVVIAIAVAFIGVIVFVSRNYLRCPPNDVLVLYGRKHRFTGPDNKTVTRGYRLITGGAAFRLPLLEQSARLSLAVMQIGVKIERAPNKDGVPVTVNSVANVRLASDPTMLGAAVEQFLGKSQQEIQGIIHRTLEGIVRQLVGTLSVEEMVRDRESISRKVIDLTGSELAKLGVRCENFVFTEVTDEKGYIEALGRKRAAEVKRDAQIGEAEADREAVIKSSEAKRDAEKKRLAAGEEIAQAERDLAVKQAQFKAETEAEQAKAALAGQIAAQERQKDLTRAQVEVERTRVSEMMSVTEQKAKLREKELDVEVRRPAEATRDAAAITAEGQRKARVITAEADAEAAKQEAEAAKARADAKKSEADAEKVRLTAEGQGRAAAAAAQARDVGLAEAEAVKAKLLAEADGVKAKNEALAQMSEGARLILVLDRLPEVLEEGGDALAKALAPAFQAVGAGLAAVDKIEIVDFGGGGADGSAMERFALTVPRIVLKALVESRELGVDIQPLLAKLGLRVSGSAEVPASASETSPRKKA